MKKFILTLFLALIFSASAMAADIVYAYLDLTQNKYQVTATVTADGSGDVAILEMANVVGMNLFDVPKVYSATDAAFTVLLTSNTGVPFISHTTTAATTGEFATAADRHTMIDAPKLDVTGLTATESCTIVLIFWRE